jgi:hypothetical protein
MNSKQHFHSPFGKDYNKIKTIEGKKHICKNFKTIQPSSSYISLLLSTSYFPLFFFSHFPLTKDITRDTFYNVAPWHANRSFTRCREGTISCLYSSRESLETERNIKKWEGSTESVKISDWRRRWLC